MLYIIDAERERVVIHRVDTLNGTYLPPRIVNYRQRSHLFGLLDSIRRDQPDQIIFDRVGLGIYLFEEFAREVQYNATLGFDVDECGLITYEK
ncbi:hypothetical protein Q7A53_05925 [Halobacillus rhizosphaerae]|uniref:hypothetical protein n=1 Tax=Halobacillus rhizosphaerae TaxID=3064889 RepID=UPI00398B0EC4